jgi:signal transduction histidine kinase
MGDKERIESLFSENRLLSESDERYKAFVHMSSEGIWRVGFEGEEPLDVTLPVDKQVELIFEKAIFEECNEAMATMYGFESPDQLIGMKVKSLLLQTNPDNVEYLKAFVTSKYRLINAESVEMDTKGNIRHFLNNMVGIVKEEKLLGAWGTQREITELKKAIDTVAAMNHQLTEKNEQLVRTNNELDNFIYTVSHDLIAPLNNIEGLVNVIKLNDCYKNEETKLLIDLMDVAVAKFKNTIRNIAEIPKSHKSGTSARDEVKFSEIIENVKFNIRDLINDTNATIRTYFECDIIHLSSTSIQSVLHNLISNGIKYRHPDRVPEIFVNTKKEGEYILLEVKDNGIGFSQDHSTDVFELFKRLHHHVEGTGIGLYIVKRIAENSGGKVEVESVPNEGACFRVYFGKF